MIWLITFIDSEAGFYKIPDQRIDKILSTINYIRTCLTTRTTVYVRKVASFVGQIISMYSVISNITYLMTKHLTIDINKLFSWYILFNDKNMLIEIEYTMYIYFCRLAGL